jgi:MFS transporter, FHS family, L-fucose permease
MSTKTDKKGFFTLTDGTNLMFTFMLVSSLFLLWGFCNGMIDVMDKHFQDELHLSKSQSAWVQFAHYLGYFLMSMPAGWLATKLGYKGGIITGLLIVALGGLWFIPATYIQEAAKAGHLSANMAFVGFLVGVCAIASGLTFLETIANPYTTVLGDPKHAATRINLAQSANGIGWILGPFIGSIYFYSKDALGVSTGSQTLYKPYAGIAVVVTVLAVIFFFAKVPDIKAEDDYHLDDKNDDAPAERKLKRPLIYLLLCMNAAILVCVFSMFLWLILSAFNMSPQTLNKTMYGSAGILVALSAVAFVPVTKKMSHHSIWSHPHFSSAVFGQFLYVAAQAGIFSFFINTMTPDKITGITIVPAIPESWNAALTHSADWILSLGNNSVTHFFHDWLVGWFATDAKGILRITDKGAANMESFGFLCFILGRFSGTGLVKAFSAHRVLAIYGLMNILTCLGIFMNWGWVSVACVFLSFFFMSIMFPTIFALGIFGLGERAKKASAFLVMAIMGGAILPKLMGAIADNSSMSNGYIVPMVCFALIGVYGFCWPKLSGAASIGDVKGSGH